MAFNDRRYNMLVASNNESYARQKAREAEEKRVNVVMGYITVGLVLMAIGIAIIIVAAQPFLSQVVH